MNDFNDRTITPEERAEIMKRKMEVKLQKKSKQASSLTELKKELGIKDKGKR
jgi:hypothetical protein